MITIPAGPADRVAAALRRHLTPDDRVQLAALLALDSPSVDVSIPPGVDAPRGEDYEIPGTTVGVNVGGEFVATGVEKDLRGEPKGAATTWELERLVRRRPTDKRRTREKVTVAYRAAGWYSQSEMWDLPFRDALCDTKLDDQWCTEDGGFDRVSFHAFHREYPVVWRVRIWQGHVCYTCLYCDPELPDEYRGLVTPDV